MIQTCTIQELNQVSLETRLSSLSETVIERLGSAHQNEKEAVAAIEILIQEIVYAYINVHPLLDERLLFDAARISYQAHQGVKRKNGQPYIVHPYQVGYILALMGTDSEVVAAGLNHDAIEKSGGKRKEITEIITKSLGEGVLRLVMAVARLPQEEIFSSGYGAATEKKLPGMMDKNETDFRIDAINVADGISNLLSFDGLRIGPDNPYVDLRAKSLSNSKKYVLPAAFRIDDVFAPSGRFKFYDFVGALIQRGQSSLQSEQVHTNQ